jgi:hypothetical protein
MLLEEYNGNLFVYQKNTISLLPSYRGREIDYAKNYPVKMGVSQIKMTIS